MNRLIQILRDITDRIPRYGWHVGLDWGNGDIEWGYVLLKWDQSLVDEEIACCQENGGVPAIVVKRIWISPARLAGLPEFGGW